ncbi:uncharacterized protein ACUW54_000357 [Staphylococcus cohnii]|nr:DNA-binding protein [Staphylococcus cohnii]SUM80428.1 DNA-binding protein [Staphylococcus cohnii]
MIIQITWMYGMKAIKMSQNDLIKTIRMNYLFDFYQSLLTEKQRNYLELFYLQDYSLSEIADTFDVSRQAVYDNIRRTGDLVEDYEEKLGLYQNFEKRQNIYEAIKKHIDEPEKIKQYLQALEDLE